MSIPYNHNGDISRHITRDRECVGVDESGDALG